MATLAEQASKLLDFNQKLDISLLDNIVGCMYSGTGEQACISLSLSHILM
jgi:exportin-1